MNDPYRVQVTGQLSLYAQGFREALEVQGYTAGTVATRTGQHGPNSPPTVIALSTEFAIGVMAQIERVVPMKLLRSDGWQRSGSWERGRSRNNYSWFGGD